MRQLTWAAAVTITGVLGLTGSAKAITQTTDIPLVDNGSSLRSATVSLNFKKPPQKPQISERKKPQISERKLIRKPQVVVHIKRRTNESGHLIIQTDDKTIRAGIGMTVDVSVTTEDGRKFTMTNLPVENVLSGLPLDVGANSSSTPAQRLGSQPTSPPTTSLSGGYIGGELVKNTGRVRSTETNAATGVVTNQFVDSGDPLGLGIVVGYNFAPWGNDIIIGPFVSADWLRQKINHNFAGGQFLGTTTNWIFTIGGKAGFVATPGLLVYGLAGASFLNHDLNVRFATSATNNVTTPGFTLGLGIEYSPDAWRVAGNPVSVFAQYQHTWWNTANFHTPASSPLSNFAFRRDDDTFKMGLNVRFSR